MLVFLLIAKGWTITRDNFGANEWRGVIIALSAFYMSNSIIIVLQVLHCIEALDMPHIMLYSTLLSILPNCTHWGSDTTLFYLLFMSPWPWISYSASQTIPIRTCNRHFFFLFSTSFSSFPPSLSLPFPHLFLLLSLHTQTSILTVPEFWLANTILYGSMFAYIYTCVSYQLTKLKKQVTVHSFIHSLCCCYYCTVTCSVTCHVTCSVTW